MRVITHVTQRRCVCGFINNAAVVANGIYMIFWHTRFIFEILSLTMNEMIELMDSESHCQYSHTHEAVRERRSVGGEKEGWAGSGACVDRCGATWG